MLLPALQTVGNIVTGIEMQIQVILDWRDHLPAVPAEDRAAQTKSIKKKACWTISNITAGTKEQIQAFFDRCGVALHCDNSVFTCRDMPFSDGSSRCPSACTM